MVDGEHAVSAADAREDLEAVIWRERGGDPRRLAQDVDRILAAADAYARAYAAAERERRIGAALDDARVRAARLAAAEASAAENEREAS